MVSTEIIDSSSCLDNCIEFIRGNARATVTFTQGRYITKIRKLANEFPNEVEIVADQGSTICAHIPTKWVKIAKPRQISEEQRLASAERLRALRENDGFEDDLPFSDFDEDEE